MTEFDELLIKWYNREITHLVKGCATPEEFEEYKASVLKLLEDHPDTDLEATFTTDKITIKTKDGKCLISNELITLSNENSKEESEKARGHRNTLNLLEEYREHDAEVISSIIIPLLNF